MGEIVAAIFTTHVPRLMIHDPEARRAYMGKNVTTFYDAMERLECERLRGLEFDTFVLIDTHWFTTLEYVLNAQQRLRGLYTSEELPQMIHEYAYDYPGDPELAATSAEAARASGLRALASGYPTLPLHYPTLNVMHYFNPGATRRVLSMGVCQTSGISNDLAFGAAMGAAAICQWLRWSTNRPKTITANSGTSLAAVNRLLTCAPARTPRMLMNASKPTSAVRMTARGRGSFACGKNSPR